jgi:hypothetical protein
MMQEADEVVSSFPSSEPISKSLVMPVLRKDGEANDDGTSQLGNIEVPDALPIDSELSSEGRAKIGMVPLAVMIFYSVSGGPFGCEASVRAGGNFYTLLGFLVMPFVWSMQEALITAELGTTFPEASGGVAWVEEAFGKNAGWMCGYLGWMAGATDNAIYPVLFLDYVYRLVWDTSTGLDYHWWAKCPSQSAVLQCELHNRSGKTICAVLPIHLTSSTPRNHYAQESVCHYDCRRYLSDRTKPMVGATAG